MDSGGAERVGRCPRDGEVPAGDRLGPDTEVTTPGVKRSPYDLITVRRSPPPAPPKRGGLVRQQPDS